MTTETTLPQGAIRIIEELLNENNLGLKNFAGNYVFPLCRAARARILEQNYDLVFPIDLPPEYMAKYEKSLQNN